MYEDVKKKTGTGNPKLFCVFTHVASIYANLLEQKKAFTSEKSSTPTGLVWDTNMAAMTSCENTQLIYGKMIKFQTFFSDTWTQLETLNLSRNQLTGLPVS